MAKGNCQSTKKHTKQFLMKTWKDDISLKTYNPTADCDNDQQIINALKQDQQQSLHMITKFKQL